MKRSLLLFGLLSAFVAHGQVRNISFRAGVNYPVISTEYLTDELTTPIPASAAFGSSRSEVTLRMSHDSQPGFDLGTSLDYGLSRRFFITTGLNISYMRFRKEVTIEDIRTPQVESDLDLPEVSGAGLPFGSIYGGSFTFRDVNGNSNGLPTQPLSLFQPSKNEGKTTTLYVQVPVLVGTTLFRDKLIVRGGATLSYLISASQYVDKYSFETQTIESHKEKGRDGYTTLLAACTFQTTYLITKSLGVDFTASQFVSPIYDDSDSFKPKYTTFSLGVSYNLTR